MQESVYAEIIAMMLLACAFCHLLLQRRMAEWLSRPGIVRAIGGGLLLLSLPWVEWRGWYAWTTFASLAISGAWRFFFPRHSIHAQERTYPRWVHGCIMLGAAVIVWALR